MFTGSGGERSSKKHKATDSPPMNVKLVTKKQKSAMLSMSTDYKPLSPGMQYVIVMLVLCILNDELFECCL